MYELTFRKNTQHGIITLVDRITFWNRCIFEFKTTFDNADYCIVKIYIYIYEIEANIFDQSKSDLSNKLQMPLMMLNLVVFSLCHMTSINTCIADIGTEFSSHSSILVKLGYHNLYNQNPNN